MEPLYEIIGILKGIWNMLDFKCIKYYFRNFQKGSRVLKNVQIFNNYLIVKNWENKRLYSVLFPSGFGTSFRIVEIWAYMEPGLKYM